MMFETFVEFETVFGTRVCVKPYDVIGLEGRGEYTAILCSRSTFLVNSDLYAVKEKLFPKNAEQ